MCRLAFSGLARTEVSDMELCRQGKSYTVDTLRALSAPGRRLALLTGTDMFLTLHSWYRAEEIFGLADIYVMRRFNDGGEEIIEKAEQYRARYAARVHYIETAPFTVSSTELRTKLESGGDAADALPPAVWEYIKKCKLYRKLTPCVP